MSKLVIVEETVTYHSVLHNCDYETTRYVVKKEKDDGTRSDCYMINQDFIRVPAVFNGIEQARCFCEGKTGYVTSKDIETYETIKVREI